MAPLEVVLLCYFGNFISICFTLIIVAVVDSELIVAVISFAFLVFFTVVIACADIL